MGTPETFSQTPEKNAKIFYRITTEQFASLPNGTQLREYGGYGETNLVVKGTDVINPDAGSSFMEYGFFEEEIPAGFQVDERGMREIKITPTDEK